MLCLPACPHAATPARQLSPTGTVKTLRVDRGHVYAPGAPVSAMPGRLRAVVCKGMEQVQAVLMEAKRAEAAVPNHRFNTLGPLMPSHPLRPISAAPLFLHRNTLHHPSFLRNNGGKARLVHFSAQQRGESLIPMPAIHSCLHARCRPYAA